MAVLKGVNSYVTVAEADAYFADRINVSAWTDATPTLKGQALVTATQILDDQRWIGTAISEDQDLAFPRSGEYFDPRLGSSVYISEETPKRILTATYELALHLLLNSSLLEDTGGVTSLNVGPIQLTSITKASLLSKSVKTAITPLLVNAGSNSWWRSN